MPIEKGEFCFATLFRKSKKYKNLTYPKYTKKKNVY